MKNLLFTFIIFTSFFSCSTNDDSKLTIDDSQDLVGVWQRADSNDDVINTFEFYADNSGIKTTTEYADDGTAISNALSIAWSIENNVLQLVMNEEINTPYLFNEDNQLVLTAISEFPFNRID